MSDNTTEVKAVFTAEVRSADKVDRLVKSLTKAGDLAKDLGTIGDNRSFEQQMNRAAGAVDHLAGRVKHLQSEIAKNQKFKDPLGNTDTLFSARTNQAVQTYSRGMQAAQTQQRAFVNAEVRGGRLTRDAWAENNRSLKSHLDLMDEVHAAGQTLSAAQVKSLQTVIARGQAMERVWARGADRLVSLEDQLANKTRQKTKAEETHARVVAESHAQQLVSAQRLYTFESTEQRKQLGTRIRFAGQKTRLLKQGQRDAEAGIASETEGVRRFESWRVAGARRTYRLIEGYRREDEQSAKAARNRAASAEAWWQGMRKKGARINAQNHREWIGALQRRTQRLRDAYKIEDDAAEDARRKDEARAATAARRGSRVRRSLVKEWKVAAKEQQDAKAAADREEAEREAAAAKRGSARRRSLIREWTRDFKEKKAEKAAADREEASRESAAVARGVRLRRSFITEYIRGEREKAQERARAHSAGIKMQRERTALRGQARRYAGKAAMAPMHMMSRADGHGYFTSPAFFAMAGFAGITEAIRRSIAAATSTDTAETNARLHMGYTAQQAVGLRQETTRNGIIMGVRPDQMLEATVDASKSGVPDENASAFAQQSVRLAKVFGMNTAQTTDDLGYAVAGLIGSGQVPKDQVVDRVRKLGNTSGYLASTMATRPDAMMSFMRTGMGSGALLGLSEKDTLAFGAAATSSGAQGQQAARMLGHIGEQMHELPLQAKAVQSKSHKSAADRLFLEIPRLLGYGSYGNLTNKMKKDPSEIFSLIEKFGKIKDPYKRDQALTAVFGADFKRFIANMAMSPGIMTSARDKAKTAYEEKDGNDFQTRAWKVYEESFQHMIDKMDAAWKAVVDQVGRVFKPFIHDLSEFFGTFALRLQKIDLAKPIQGLLNGAIKGLGFDNFQKMLEGFLPKRFAPRGKMFNSENWSQFGEGFTSGIKRVYEFIKGIGQGIAGVLAKFGIDSKSPKAIGEMIGSLMAWSVAIHFARPAFALLGFVKDGLMGLAAGIWAINAALKAARIGTAASVAGSVAGGSAGMAGGAVAGSALGSRLGALRASRFGSFMGINTGMGAILSRYFILYTVAEVAQYTPQISNAILTAVKAMFRSMYDGVVEAIHDLTKDGFLSAMGKLGREALRALDPNLVDDRPGARGPDGKYKPEPGADKSGMRSIWEWLTSRSSFESGGGFDRSLIHRSSFGQSSSGAGVYQKMLHNAAFNPTEEVVRNTKQVANTLQYGGARIQLAALNGAAIGAGFAFQGGGVGGGGGGGAIIPGMGGAPTGPSGLPRAPGMTVPGFYGKGRAIGGVHGDGSKMPDPGAGISPYKPLLDHIARSEGTAGGVGGGYNVSLANGKLLPGGQEMDLKNMTLDQIDALQGQMLKNPNNKWNSSALGRYQIVRKTLRGLRAKLGLKGDQKFDENLQDRLGAELIKQRGASGGLGDEWASLRGDKLQTAIGLAGAIPQGASTTPTGRPEGPSGGGNVAERIADLRKSGAISGTECVDLVKSWTGTKDMTTRQWRKGDGAADGTLKPGDAIATFLGPDGKPSSQYAGGTGGRAGAGRDHAAVFDSYIKNEAGKIIGMNVIEQYNKTKGQQVRGKYMFGEGFGEKNGSNYSKVLGPDGQPLARPGSPGASALADARTGADKGFTSSGWKKAAWERKDGGPWVQEFTGLEASADKAKQLTEGAEATKRRIMQKLSSGVPAADGGFTSDGWKKAVTPSEAASAAPAKPTASELAGSAKPMNGTPFGSSGGQTDIGGSGTTIHAPVTINAGAQSPSDIANSLQRHVAEARNFRSHDMEPELT